MNKLFLFIAFIFTGLTAGYTQERSATALSIGGEFGFPAGAASSVYGSVLGASVKLELPVAKSNFHVDITSGYSIFLTKFNYGGPYSSSLYVPVEVGAGYYFSKIGYVEGDLGFSADVTGNYTSSSMAFIYSPLSVFRRRCISINPLSISG